jgi:hypothetical protein
MDWEELVPVKTKRQTSWLAISLVALLLLAACGSVIPDAPTEQPTASPEAAEPEPTDTPSPTSTATDALPTEEAASNEEYKIVTLLPKDAIPAIDEPEFYGILDAEREYHPQELVMGVEVDGEARAYSVALLSRHEIVNDTVGGHPISITW